ncbi:RNA exonuclease 1 homolog isoform X2 [Hippoglossus stenolepis]|uniref:RNA exonuclease 1 homolog isoform X2 n=1 Tax=Hippoglossus stenolepis TaxID=195615 RepID=UPI001FAF2DC7|nr:RNA exonuclease 1 homolog isoform X2 [Hippoglossus stenolepis]
MFRSSGLFADVKCPSRGLGLCERPHCFYKHGSRQRAASAASAAASFQPSAVPSAEVQNCYLSLVCGSPASDDTTDDSLQELERINKEIEAVRHEVEQEQRRLSHYQTIQSDSRNTVSKSETTGKRQDRRSLSSHSDVRKTYSRTKKYVVDNSKPRTDLEYDPLSNFSADLRSYSSSSKEQKVKNAQVINGERDPVPCDQKRPVAQAPFSPQTPSPGLLEDPIEDSVLIIDIPPSPDQTRGQSQKPDCVAGSAQGTVEQLKERVPIALDSPLLRFADAAAYQFTSPRASRVESLKAWENIPVDGSVIDLTGCLEDLENECQRISCQAAETEVDNSPEPVSPPASSDQQYQSYYNLGIEEEENAPQVELPLFEVSGSVERMNPLQSHYFQSKHSPSYTAPAANSGSPCRKRTTQAQTTEMYVHNHLSPKRSAPPLVSGSQEMSGTIPGQMQGGSLINQASAVVYQEQAEPASGSNQCQNQNSLSTSVNSHLMNRGDSTSETTEELLVKEGHEEVIIISSSEDEQELNYSDIELSESDPMEECYRIFMEANDEDKGNKEQPDVSVAAMEVEKAELTTTPQTLPGKKRVAHEAKHAEPLAKSRPQAKILIPLREPAASGSGSQSSIPSKILPAQQRASMLTASVKGAQAFASFSCQKKPETQTTACPPQTPANIQPAPVQNAYINYLPLGTPVIQVGSNLHLILPEGTFPLSVTSSSCPVSSVLTPVTQVHMSTMKQTCHKAAVTPVQRYHPTAPMLIPAPTRKTSLASATAHLHPAASTTSQPTAAAKPAPTKRRLKQQSGATKEKVPHDVRQRYVTMFTEEFLKTTANVNEAFEKAVAEEETVYNRSANKLKYLSVAVNSLKRLKKQSCVSSKDENEVNGQRSKGNITFNLEMFQANDDVALYESLKDYILTEEKLIESNYPVQHPEKAGSAALFADNKKGSTDPLKRICCRCGATYSVGLTGKHIRKEECNYHYGKVVKNKVPGGVETRYSCCQGVMGAPGCQVFKLHVHDFISMDGFVSTKHRHPMDTSCPGVYSLNCEMCYTVHGLELSRVTVINSSLQVIYDTFVRPDHEVIDYNTRFSGIGEEDVKGNYTSVREVQETLQSFISADTILIGHGLEADLCGLKLLHGTVVDTSLVFPHRLGPPHKLTLNKLTAEYLLRIIQESGGSSWIQPRHKCLQTTTHLNLHPNKDKITVVLYV